jgi:hypothetical protein
VDEIEIKAEVTEKRTRQAAKGKEKLGLARNHAALVIKECMKGHEVPAPISKATAGSSLSAQSRQSSGA